MNLDDTKFIYDDENLEFEDFNTQIPVPHNVFPNLAPSDEVLKRSSSITGLTTPPMNTTPLIPINIQQLIDDKNTDTIPPSDTESDTLIQYNKPDTSYSNKVSNPPISGDPMPQDILRQYDLSIEKTLNRGANKTEEIFSSLQNTDLNIMDILNEYRIPSPISKAIVKKVINFSVDFIDKE